MKKIKVYVIGPSIGYASWLPDIVLVSNLEEADIVWFTGGADINPKLYNEPAHSTSYFSNQRDEYEVYCYKKMTKKQLAIGTCRGAQLFCALNGGKLVQNVTGHCGCSHQIKLVGSFNGLQLPETCYVSSIHHQMMYPYDMPDNSYTVLYTADPRISSHYDGTGFNENKIKLYGEPEVVLFTSPNHPVSLGIQGHPEMMDRNSCFVKAMIELTHQLLEEIHTKTI